MIISDQELATARRTWAAAGGDLADFDVAANVLDYACCHADVRYGLTNPTYHHHNPGGGEVWHISVGGKLMLKYKLREDLSAGTAEVEIVP